MGVLAVYGGQPYERQIRRLQRGVDVVVGTPGRLLDLIRQNALDLSAVRTVVLDEADEMLSMGFIEDIETILGETPEVRQTALFSATLPAEIRRLAERYMADPQSVRVGSSQVTVDGLAQRYYLVNEADKLAALSRMFEVEEISSALIFARTRAGTGELASELTARGFPAEALNGDLSQDAREQVLQRFRRGQCSVLVATDVAARGLDIDDISHVFNYDLPMDAGGLRAPRGPHGPGRQDRHRHLAGDAAGAVAHSPHRVLHPPAHRARHAADRGRHQAAARGAPAGADGGLAAPRPQPPRARDRGRSWSRPATTRWTWPQRP